MSAATVWLLLASLVGVVHVGNRSQEVSTASEQFAEGGGGGEGDGTAGGAPVDPVTGEPQLEGAPGVPGGGVPGSPGVPGAPGAPAGPGGTGPNIVVPGAPAPGGGTATTRSAGTGSTAAPARGDRTGVTATTVKIGIHAPKTIGGAPLNLAEDPLKGVEAYVKFINDRGGIHGRKLVLDIRDDRYETNGGKAAGVALIENGNFLISGTLGVDQISAVAIEAKKAGVPYMAAGGNEKQFAGLGVFQFFTSYDTHVIQLARFLAKDPDLKGKKVGISALDSPLMSPVVDIFKAEAARLGVQVVQVVTVQKPTSQSTYTAQIQKLKDAGTQVFVPIQDPITTGRMVSECRAALCPWTYTFSNFAHEADAALTVMGGEWGRLKVKGLAASCSHVHGNVPDRGRCAAMAKAREQWIAVHGERDWIENGQSGAFGYQLVSFIAEGLRRAGRDLTREGYVNALKGYNGFNDLITSPISFAGRSAFSHGAEKMVVLQAGTNDKYVQINDGLAEF